jgi:hypothetical protein
LTTAISPPPHPCSNAQPRPHPSGWISVSRDKIFATMPRRRPPIAKALALKPDYAEAALNLGIVLQDGGEGDAAMRALPSPGPLRPDRNGVDIGPAWPALARRRRAAAITRCLTARVGREKAIYSRTFQPPARRPKKCKLLTARHKCARD